MTRSASKRSVLIFVFIAWLLDALFDWARHLGSVGDVIEWLWFVLLGYFVVSTRSGRTPRWFHTWAWTSGLLVICVLHGLWLGWTNGNLGFFAKLADQFPQLHHELRKDEITGLGSITSSVLIGLAEGISAAVYAALIAVFSWFGDRLREDAVAARVALMPRIAVSILQAPIFLTLVVVGVSAIVGAVGLGIHTGTATGIHAAEGIDAAARRQVPLVLALGIAAWSSAILHVGRLNALASGGLANRYLLSAVAIASGGGATVLVHNSIPAILVVALWVTAQLASLRWAGLRTLGPAETG